MNLLDRLDTISDAVIKLDEKIGFKRILLYIVLVLCLYGIFNFKTIVKESIQLVQEMSEEIHTEKMEKRDELLKELSPILLELRTAVGADRVLYFEYHNSKENLVGIPFKYIDLVLQNTRYGVSNSSEILFKDINVGAITPLYETIKTGNIVICNGSEDTQFLQSYQGTYELFHEIDGSHAQAFISIPGVKQPIGMIVLEWVDHDGRCTNINASKLEDIVFGRHNNFISRINGLIMSKQ